jgi:hypothetical protein
MGDSDGVADYHRRAVAAAVERHREIQDLLPTVRRLLASAWSSAGVHDSEPA